VRICVHLLAIKPLWAKAMVVGIRPEATS